MDTCMMFLDCPEYMDEHGTVRCGLPAEVQYRYELVSTDGPLESAKIGCPRGHWFNGPIEFLNWDRPHTDRLVKSAGDALTADVRDTDYMGPRTLHQRGAPRRSRLAEPGSRR